jgi:uncharacterized RDD family membrane protein YckC
MIKNPSLLKKTLACIYELLLLAALWMIVVAIYIAIVGEANSMTKRFLLQLLLWVSTGAYFVRCWCKTGQTLAMQTWKLKVVNSQGHLLTIKQALIRYVFASISFLVLGFGFLWAILDKDRQFLHDRLLQSKIVLQKDLS